MITPVQRSMQWNRAHPDRHKSHVYKWREKNLEKARAINRACYEKHKEERKTKARLWRKNNKELASSIDRKKSLKGRYGISLEEYQILFYKQSGICAICKNGASRNKNLSVDHRHSDGKIRGLLCHNCNLVIGNAKDNCDTLRQAIEYLENHIGS